MKPYKYGEYTKEQISSIKKYLQKQIFFLLLIVDPKTKNEYENINVAEAIRSVLFEIGGFNSCLNYPAEVVRINDLIEAALNEYLSPDFCTNDFKHCAYRKLILDAGAKVNEIKEV